MTASIQNCRNRHFPSTQSNPLQSIGRIHAIRSVFSEPRPNCGSVPTCCICVSGCAQKSSFLLAAMACFLNEMSDEKINNEDSSLRSVHMIDTYKVMTMLLPALSVEFFPWYCPTSICCLAASAHASRSLLGLARRRILKSPWLSSMELTTTTDNTYVLGRGLMLDKI